MENNNKSIASRWFNNTQPAQQQPQAPQAPQAPQPQPLQTVEQKDNPVRHQYRQTVLNGLKGESYV